MRGADRPGVKGARSAAPSVSSLRVCLIGCHLCHAVEYAHPVPHDPITFDVCCLCLRSLHRCAHAAGPASAPPPPPHPLTHPGFSLSPGFYDAHTPCYGRYFHSSRSIVMSLSINHSKRISEGSKVDVDSETQCLIRVFMLAVKKSSFLQESGRAGQVKTRKRSSCVLQTVSRDAQLQVAVALRESRVSSLSLRTCRESLLISSHVQSDPTDHSGGSGPGAHTPGPEGRYGRPTNLKGKPGEAPRAARKENLEKPHAITRAR